MAQTRKTTSKTVKTPVGLYPHDLLYGQAGKATTTKAITINSSKVSLDIEFLLFMYAGYSLKHLPLSSQPYYREWQN
jgi:hypothetical protein